MGETRKVGKGGIENGPAILAIFSYICWVIRPFVLMRWKNRWKIIHIKSLLVNETHPKFDTLEAANLITCIYLRYTCALPGHFSSIILMKLIKAEVQV
jgi:hypothetical protein